MMTSDQLTAFRTQVKAQVQTDTNLAAAYAAKDCDKIAAIMSVGRTTTSDTEIGNGSILDTLGLTVGNSVLDTVHADSVYKYVIALLDQGRLKIGSATAQKALSDLVTAGTLTQANADSLTALCIVPDPVNASDVHLALFQSDGTPL